MQASFPGNLQLVLVLRPTGFFHRALSDIAFRFNKDELKMKVPVSNALFSLYYQESLKVLKVASEDQRNPNKKPCLEAVLAILANSWWFILERVCEFWSRCISHGQTLWADMQWMPVVKSPVNPQIVLLFASVQHLYFKIKFETIWADGIEVIVLIRCKFQGWKRVFKKIFPHLSFILGNMTNPCRHCCSLLQTQDNKEKWTRNGCCF